MKKYYLLSLIWVLILQSKAQNPTLVNDINPGLNSSTPSQFVVFNGKLYFQADDGVSGVEVWEYDGINTPQRISNISPGGFANPLALTVFNGNLYFRAEDNINGGELWKYDGVNTPSLVADIYAGVFSGTGGFNPEFIVYKNALYFQGDEGTNGGELWMYDGVNAPSLVADIYPGAVGSTVSAFAVYNDTLYFSADNGTDGAELMKFDGVNPPQVAANINPGANSSFPTSLFVFNNKLYFTAEDGTNGSELWVYDDITQTASMVADINSGSLGSLPANFAVYQNKLYFSADDGSNGQELWVYDGVNAPSLAADIYPGFLNASFPDGIYAYNDTLYFIASNDIYGFELWKYDGANPAQIVADIFSGSTGSFPTGPIEYNGMLYFGADDSITGHELRYINTSCTPTFSTDIQMTCDSLIWTDGNTYYTSTTTAKDTLVNAAGCDSIITLNLTIHPSIYKTDTLVACDSLVWIDGITYYEDTVGAEYAWFTSQGCDSVVKLDLTIKNSSFSIDSQTACDSLVWIDGNTYYTNNNTAVHTLVNSQGCDSTILLNLTINNSVLVTDTKVACDSFKWINGVTYYASNNTAKDTLQASNGCDSIIALNLTIHNSYATIDSIKACDQYTWIDGITYNVNDYTATHLLSSVNGCDSLVTLYLEISRPTKKTLNFINCDSAVVNGISYLQEGRYTQNFISSFGCDSTVEINYVKQYPEDTITATKCGNYNLNDILYTTTGIYQVIIPDCDTVVLDLTINPIDTTFIYDTTCGSYSYGGITYNKSGIYKRVFNNSFLCDSVVFLDLVVKSNSYVIDYQVACDSFTWVNNGITYYESTDTAVVILPKSNGCDSVVLLNLTINKTTYGTLSDVSCIGKTINGQYIDSSGTYTQTLVNKAGCDSILTLDFIFTNTDTAITANVCGEFKYGDTIYKNSGTFLRDVPGCSGKVTLNLTIRSTSEIKQTITACKSYVWEGDTIIQSGIYKKTYINALGCDSTLILDLTIDDGNTTKIKEKGCTSYVFDGNVLTTTGVYYDTLLNQNGCDSIVELDLEISPWEKNINDLNITSNLTLGSYLNETIDLSDDGKTKAYFVGEPNNNNVKVYAYQLSGTDWIPKGAPIVLSINPPHNYSVGDLSGDGNSIVLIEKKYQYTACYVYRYNGSSWVKNGNTIDTLVDVCFSTKAVALNYDGTKLAAIGFPTKNPCFISGNAFFSTETYCGIYDFSGGVWAKSNDFRYNRSSFAKEISLMKFSKNSQNLIFSFVSGFQDFFSSAFFEDEGVVVFENNGGNWQQKGSTIKGLPVTTPKDDDHNNSLLYHFDISADGTKLAVLKDWYPAAENSILDFVGGYGAVSMFDWNATSSNWDPLGNTLIGSDLDHFQAPIKISNNGTKLYIGTEEFDQSPLTNLNFNTLNENTKMFELSGGTWTFKENLVNKNTDVYFSEYGDTIVCLGRYSLGRKTETFTRCIDSASGIEELVTKNENLLLPIVVFPNPNNGQFTIEIKDLEIYGSNQISYYVFNSIGKVINSGYINNQQTQLNINEHANGLYFLQLRYGDVTQTERIVIQKH